MDIVTLIFMLICANIIYRIMISIISARNEMIIDQKVAEGMKKLKETIIPSVIEESNGILYLYNAETNEFIAQGKNFEDLNHNAKARFPDKLFNVPQDEINKYTGGIK